MRLASGIHELIGDTPALQLDRLVAHLGLSGRLIAKLEYLNPGLSKKDRVGRSMVETAKADGALAPGQPVVELTSGNTGTGLAIVCAALGHPFIAVMSAGNTPERAGMMRAFGAEVVLVDQEPGAVAGQVSGADLALVEQRAAELVVERGAFRADQFTLASSADVHERTTGPELWEQSGHDLDGYVSFVGSAGSFTGVARYLATVSPATRCFVVEPVSTPALAGGDITSASHRIQGGGYSFEDLTLLDRSLVSDYLTVSDDEAIEHARLLARHEGVLGGFSTGADCAAAVSLLRGPLEGGTVTFLASDSGLKYLSTDLY